MKRVYRARFPNTRRAAAQARRTIIGHVARYGYPAQDLADIETAIGEALANAAEHGNRSEGGFEVRVSTDGARLVIEVQDDGSGFHANLGGDVRSPGHEAPRGFGIYLMRHLMDEVEYRERGTCVRMTKTLPIARQDETSANCG